MGSEMCIRDRFKLIKYRVAGNTRYQLFDLVRDPLEMHDLANDDNYAAELTELKKCMSEWQHSANDPVISVDASQNVDS